MPSCALSSCSYPIALLIAAVTSATPHHVDAQTCRGQEQAGTALKRLGGLVELGDHYTSYQATLGLGSQRRFFGGGGAGVTRSNGGGAVVISVEAGYGGFRAIEDRLHICPSLRVNYDRAFGPATDFSFGVAGGYRLGSAGANSRLVVMGSVAIVLQLYQLGGGYVVAEWYGTFDAGFGIRISQPATLTLSGRLYEGFGAGRHPSLILRVSSRI